MQVQEIRLKSVLQYLPSSIGNNYCSRPCNLYAWFTGVCGWKLKNNTSSITIENKTHVDRYGMFFLSQRPRKYCTVKSILMNNPAQVMNGSHILGLGMHEMRVTGQLYSPDKVLVFIIQEAKWA